MFTSICALRLLHNIRIRSRTNRSPEREGREGLQSPGALLLGPPIRERGEGTGRRVDAPASAAEEASLSWWTAAAAAAAGVADSAISPLRTLGRPAPTAPLCPTPGRVGTWPGQVRRRKRARARSRHGRLPCPAEGDQSKDWLPGFVCSPRKAPSGGQVKGDRKATAGAL